MKVLKSEVDDLDVLMEETSEKITTVIAEIKALQDGITQLDKDVAEATEQRKGENSDYTELMAGDAAAKELIGMAKNRMQKFYNPKLYKPPAPTTAPVFVQIQQHVQHKADPGPPPALDFGGSKGSEATGVLAMMDAIVQDLDKEMTEAEAEEKDAQGDYEKMMKDSAAKRAEDTKMLSEKEGAKADMEADLGKANEDKTATTKELF